MEKGEIRSIMGKKPEGIAMSFDFEEEDLPPYPAYEDVEIEIRAVLGKAEVRISNLLKIGRGALIDLDRDISDTIEIFANGQRIALADILVSDDKLAFRVTKVFKRNLLFNNFALLNRYS
ncbi:MAG: FliM/FliN family flagellar motor switch protein [Alphaproteobacteria bacterium]|nr:FliM/FliN family flagellar motor switch protein [Alphaproteobacteria bacterium]